MTQKTARNIAHQIAAQLLGEQAKSWNGHSLQVDVKLKPVEQAKVRQYLEGLAAYHFSRSGLAPGQ